MVVIVCVWVAGGEKCLQSGYLWKIVLACPPDLSRPFSKMRYVRTYPVLCAVKKSHLTCLRIWLPAQSPPTAHLVFPEIPL